MKKITLPLLLALGVGLFLACNKDKDDAPPTGDEGIFTLENQRELLTTSVNETGAEIVLDQNTGAFDRIVINIPEDSYDQSIQHRISAVDVTASTFDDLIDPFYTALRVDNGGEESLQPISIIFELDASGPEIWGAFYYEEDPGELHGIPVIRRTDTEVEILVWHFSDIILSKVEKAQIQNVGMRDLGFDVKENYWNFPNITTFLDSDGMCSGMTVGAMYFFEHPEVEDGFDQVFDNHPDLFQTPDYYDDDTRGIKFASTVQAAFSGTMQASYNYEYQEDVPTFWSTAYYLNFKKQPQILILQGPAQGNHAVLVVGFTSDGASNGKLSIVDPNWYPASIREINLVSGKLEDYESALNSKDLQDGIKYVFNEFVLFPHYKFKKSDLDKIWADVKNDVYSENEYRYPIIRYWVENADNPSDPKIELQDLVDGGDTYVPYDRIKFSATNEQGIDVKLFGRTGTEAGNLTDRDPLEGEFDLTNNDLFLGIGCWTGFEPDYDKRDWTDFQYSIVRKGSFSIQSNGYNGAPFDEAGKPGEEYQMHIKSNGALASNFTCEWQFGVDGPTRTVANDTLVDFTFEEEGVYTVTVDIFQDGKSIGKVSRTATIVEPWQKKYSLIITDTANLTSGFRGFLGFEYPFSLLLNPRVVDPPTNLRFRWEFGDGTSIESKSETVRKVFSLKPYKSTVVSVFDDDNGQLIGQDSIAWANEYFPRMYSIPDDIIPNVSSGGRIEVAGALYTFDPPNPRQVFKNSWNGASNDINIDASGFSFYPGSAFSLEGTFNSTGTRIESITYTRNSPGDHEEVLELRDIRITRTNVDLNNLVYSEPLNVTGKVVRASHRHWDINNDEWVVLTDIDWSNAYVVIELW